MAKFNSLAQLETVKNNYEGGEAYLLSDEMELYSAVVTSTLSNKFYETASEQIERISELVGKCNPVFVAQLAVYARQQMNLRSIPLFLVVELANVHSGELSHQVQAGLQSVFNRFDEYQFAKYNRDNLEVKLRDALFIVHPKAKDEAQQALLDKIASKSLDTPYTWETELSALGQHEYESAEEKEEAVKSKWEELIASGKLGYMALLRNLRNILDADVDAENVKDVAERIGNPYEVARSKQFPFRYLSAYRELRGNNNGNTHVVMDALENACLATAQNIAGFDQDTGVLLACDVSGSMYSSISARSSVMNYDIGLVLAMLLKNRCENVITGIFGDTWKVINMPSKNVLANVECMYKRNGEVGYSTNGYKVIEYLRTQNIKMDKVMMFTDCQMWNSYEDGKTMQSEWKQYKQMYPDARLYLFDLAGYGQSPVRIVANDVTLVAGWSDKVFDMLSAIENGSGVIEEIRKIEL